MEIQFILDKENRDRYFITVRGRHTYNAIYNPQYQTKEIRDLQDNLITWGHYDPEVLKTKIAGSFPYAVELMVPGQPTQVEQRILFQRKLFPERYFFEFKGASYLAIMHTGYKISIFRDDVQIAYYLTGTLWGETDWTMKLICNENAPHALLSLFCLRIYSNFLSEDTGDTQKPSFNLSLFQKKRFDKSWKPS